MFPKSNSLFAVIMGLLLFVLSACTVESTEPTEPTEPTGPTTETLKLISASSISPTSIKLIFNEAVGASASQPSNYSIITADSTAGLTVESAVITGVSVDLTTSAQTAQTYIVNVSNLATAEGGALDVNASSTSFQGTAAPAEIVGAAYNISFNTLFLVEDACDPRIASVDIFYTIKLNGTNLAAVTESNQINMDAGNTHNINASREVTVTKDRPGDLSIVVKDAEAGDDLTIVNFTEALTYPLTEGDRDVTDSADGCKVRVSWTVTKVRDISE